MELAGARENWGTWADGRARAYAVQVGKEARRGEGRAGCRAATCQKSGTTRVGHANLDLFSRGKICMGRTVGQSLPRIECLSGWISAGPFR
jgi:hypothetical protein